MINLSTLQLMRTNKVLNMVFAFMIGANKMWPELKFTITLMTLTGQFNVFWMFHLEIASLDKIGSEKMKTTS
jgi:hypothetical protein